MIALLTLLLFYSPPPFQGGGWGVVDLQSVDRNFFGLNIDPAHDTITHSHWNSADTAQTNAYRITYSKPTATSDTLIVKPEWADECGSSRAIMQKKKDQPLAMPPFDSNYYCTGLYKWALQYQTDGDYKKEFDTTKKFIETCPFNSYAPAAFSLSALRVLKSASCLSRSVKMSLICWI